MVRDGTTVGSIHKPHKDNTKPIIGDGITYFFPTFLFVYSPNLIALINNPLLTKKIERKLVIIMKTLKKNLMSC